MAIAIGTQLGFHEITGLLGKGGMGEVYRARDLKLKREVAIKVLPEEFSRDADRVSRFQREAQVLASLNHPNIAHIYGLEDSNQMRCIVMELVEGEDLQERLQRGPIPLSEALPLAMQIAAALDGAHERGIIHRDLKPANIKFTPDGKVKVLDFGLAKVFESEAQTPHSKSPTLVGASIPGVIMGTAAYMSPEQAKGKEADRASDVWAFGCVLYEMLAGRRAFEGETVGEILGGIFRADPDWGRLPAETPEAIRRLLRRCLQKERGERLKSADDARIEIMEALRAPASVAPVAGARRKPSLAWVVAAVMTAAFAAMGFVHFREKPADAPEIRLDIATPSTPAPLEFALSPDGKYVVFVASGGGPQRLWLRALDNADATPIENTEGADYPFWSPDSRSIAFIAGGKLKRLDLAGGSPQTLASVSLVLPGAWGPDGALLINSIASGTLSRVAATGGDPVAVTHLVRGQAFHRFPQFLPDGRHFLFYAAGTPDVSGVFLASLDGGEPKRLTPADSHAAYLSSGMLLFLRQTSLLAQRFDAKRAELTGEPVRLADRVGFSGVGFGGFSVSANGRIAYRGGGATTRQFKWYDRTGKLLGAVGELDAGNILYPELSPDGQGLAMQRTLQGNTDLWLMDILRGVMTRFTSDIALDVGPVWSPDGKQIAFVSNKTGTYNIYLKASNNAGAESLKLETPNNKYVQDWSKDGRFLLYVDSTAKTGRDLWALPITDGDPKPIEVIKTPFEETNGQFSPDGHWVAYETNESGQPQIVVQPFPVASGKWQVSQTGGTQVRWKPDGKELYFISPDAKLTAVPVTTSGATFIPGTPTTLFPAVVVPGGGANRQNYSVSRDGRFLLDQTVEAASQPITLILNWHPEHGK